MVSAAGWAVTTVSAIRLAAYELAAVELREVRAEVIEECAREVELRYWGPQADRIAAAIRALKDKP